MNHAEQEPAPIREIPTAGLRRKNERHANQVALLSARADSSGAAAGTGHRLVCIRMAVAPLRHRCADGQGHQLPLPVVNWEVT